MSKNIKKMSHFIPLRFRLGISGETFLQGETHKRQAKDSIFFSIKPCKKCFLIETILFENKFL